MGEVILRSMLQSAGLHDGVVVDSAGTGGWHEGDAADPRTVRTLRDHGYDGTRHRAREFRPEWFSERDLIVVADQGHARDLRRWAPDADAAAKVRLMREFDSAAVDARTDDDFVIMARTDAAASEGIDAAIERAVACVEAGADAIFPEAMTDLSMYRKFVDAVKVPVLANITEFGQTPLFTRDELGTAGVAMILYPLSAFRAMNKAAENVYAAIRRDGTQQNVVDTMQTRMELYDSIGYHDYEAKLDALFAQNRG
jgi:protein-tyrosine-phosphatase